jgi:mannose-6-phosphate isomerase-like protein (cupin superfamily)
MTEQNQLPKVVNIAQKFNLFHEPWQPRIVGEANGNYVKLARIKGEFIWHQHANEDEMFLVIKGKLQIRLHEGDLWVKEGEFVIIPRGVEHLPLADEEVQVMLLEPRSTVNTGEIQHERTVADQWI